MNWTTVLRSFSLFLAVVLPLGGCQQEQNNHKEELILGRWDIQTAYRNGQATESLAELYFEFFQDGTMNTNLLGAPETGTYELEDGELHQRESQMDIDYNIEELSDSSLILTTNLRDYNFRFRLHRNIQEE